MPAMECNVLALGLKPRAALFDGAVRTTSEQKVCSVGTTTTCMRVVLPHPPPPIIRVRGKPKSLGNLRKVATVAHGVLLAFEMHPPSLLHGPYLQCYAINLFVVDFEWVLRILFDALDEFPSDVPWAAQDVFERQIDALFVVFSFVPGAKLQQVF